VNNKIIIDIVRTRKMSWDPSPLRIARCSPQTRPRPIKFVRDGKG